MMTRRRHSATTVLALLIAGPDALPQTGNSPSIMQTRRGRLGVQSTIRDLLRHPSFAQFSHLILPWDDRAYDEDLPLARISSLLPYHTHVDPETVVSGLNRMIDDVAGGQTRPCSTVSTLKQKSNSSPPNEIQGFSSYEQIPARPSR